MKVFLDTNVILDVLQERVEFMQDSMDVIQMGIDKSIELLATPLTFATCHYILRREIGKDKAQEALRSMKSFISVTFMDEVQVTKSLMSNMPDFEDILQYESALANACDVIVTRNGKHFPQDTLPVMTPSQFLSQYD